MGTEKARSNTDKISRLIDKPLTPLPAPYDRKWRFFWRIGPRPVTTNFPSLNMEPVIPKNFPQWADTMDCKDGLCFTRTYCHSYSNLNIAYSVGSEDDGRAIYRE
jgi:hypothetical protein